MAVQIERGPFGLSRIDIYDNQSVTPPYAVAHTDQTASGRMLVYVINEEKMTAHSAFAQRKADAYWDDIGEGTIEEAKQFLLDLTCAKGD